MLEENKKCGYCVLFDIEILKRCDGNCSILQLRLQNGTEFEKTV